MKTNPLRMIGAIAVWSILVMVPAGADEGHSPGGKKLFMKHFEESLFDITKNASYSIEILLDNKEYDIGKDSIGVALHNDRDVDVTGATFTLVLKNLDSGKPASGTPTITEKGGGLYIVKGLDLQQKGRWELTVTASKNGTEDHAIFLFPDVLRKRHKKGKYSP